MPTRTSLIHSMRTYQLVAMCLPAAMLLFGCNKVVEPDYQKPSIVDKYETPRGDTLVFVRAEDLGVDHTQLADSGPVILDQEPSVGRFPSGLAVAKVVAAANPERADRHILVAPVAPFRGVYWGEVMRDLPTIREVTMLRSYGTDPRGTDVSQLLHMATRMECSLCIIYAVVENTRADAEYVGVLWDALISKPLATFRVPIVLSENDRAAYEEDEDHGYERMMKEADFRAESDLQRLVCNALWDLAETDSKDPTTRPSPWRQGDMPLYPRDYDARIRNLLRQGTGR